MGGSGGAALGRVCTSCGDGGNTAVVMVMVMAMARVIMIMIMMVIMMMLVPMMMLMADADDGDVLTLAHVPEIRAVVMKKPARRT